jgi:thiamine biosynthesis lipoprotein ApbE
VAAEAALADAWSTALMLMTREQASLCVAQPSPVQAAYADLDSRVVGL